MSVDIASIIKQTRDLVSEAAATGFNCHDGDWADKLYSNQAALTSAIKLLSEPPADIKILAEKTFQEILINAFKPHSDTFRLHKTEAIAAIEFVLLSERQRQAEVKEEVRKVLASSDALLKRLMHVHVAPDECTSHVADSQRWFYDNGGTLACLADQFEAIRALLSRLEGR